MHQRLALSADQGRTRASLDYETKTSYSVSVSVSDGNGGSDRITVAINITDVNEAIPNRQQHHPLRSRKHGIGCKYRQSYITDADGNTLTYSLGGTNASAFSIVSRSGQLRTKASLDYETKTSYSVSVSVSDGNGGSDRITVAINITDVNEAIPNRAPVFTDGSSTTRSVAENTASGVNIGSPISATDADGNTLTYSLGGTNASAFSIVSRSGQLRTKASLDYETKTSYSVSVSVSDGNGGSDRITVTINITDINEVIPNRAPVFTDGSSTTRSVAENTASGINIGTAITATDADNDRLSYTLGGTDANLFSIGRTTGQLKTRSALDYETKPIYTVTITASDGSLTDTITVTINVTDVDDTPTLIATTAAPLTEASLHGSVATLTLSNDTYHTNWNFVSQNVEVSGITGVTFFRHNMVRVSDTKVTVELEFNGDITTDGTLTFTVGAAAITNYNGPALTAQIRVSSITESLNATTTAPLTEATLHDSVITLTLSGATYDTNWNYVHRNVEVSGITGVTIRSQSLDRVSDTKATVELEFNGDFDTDGTLTFTVGAAALANYNGPALTAQIRVSSITEPPTSLIATTTAPLTEATLHDSVITLTLSGATYDTNWNYVHRNVEVSGITGVTIRSQSLDRVSDTKATVELEFNGDITTDGTLTFTVGAAAITNYNGPALTAQIRVSSITESLNATTTAPLTEATLHDSVITLTLSGATYDTNWNYVSGNVAVSGITGVTIRSQSLDRVSDTKATVELEFNGDFDTDGTLTFTVGAAALANYNGPALTAQIRVSSITEPPTSLIATTTAPLTEATLHDSVITLTLSGATYDTNWNYVHRNVEVSGITGVTIRSQSLDRVSDTKATVELEFNGDFDTDGTLTFTVGAAALANYNGPALTAQISVSSITEPPTSLIATTTAPLTEATLHDSVITLTLSGATYDTNWNYVHRNVEVSGITGVTIRLQSLDRVSDTKATVELEFNGDITTDGTLTFTVGAAAITNYNGPALTAQIRVSSITESLNATTTAPLTEATLHDSVITLTLSGATYDTNWNYVNRNVAVSGITGVTIRSQSLDRVSDTKAIVELEFNGDFDTDGTLTFTVGAAALANYNGPALTAQIRVSSITEPPTGLIATTAAPLTEATLHDSVVTLTLSGATYDSNWNYVNRNVAVSGITGVTIRSQSLDRVSDTKAIVELEFNGDFDTDGTLTFTVGAAALANYNGPALTAQIRVSSITEPLIATSLIATTAAPLTEATLHESVITLTLSGGTFERNKFTIRDAITLTGIAGVTVDTFGVDRVSDTEATVELAFDGNMTSDSNLTISLGADAIKDYDGAALTSQISVTAVTESITASTASTLTEATLDGSVVTLTLSGRKYERWSSTIRPAVSVSGISGVTVGTYDIDRESDTEVSVELTFDGDITTDGTLTFTVGAGCDRGLQWSCLHCASLCVCWHSCTRRPCNTCPTEHTDVEYLNGKPTHRSNTSWGYHHIQSQ